MFARISGYEQGAVQAVRAPAPCARTPAGSSEPNWTIPDFYRLYCALESEPQVSGTRRSAAQQFGLAVHRQVRHWCIQERSRFLVAAAPGCVELYGGYHIVRRADGTIASNLLLNIDSLSFSDLPTMAYRSITQSMLNGMSARINSLFVAQAQQAGLTSNQASRQLAQFETWVGWAYFTFKPACWGRRMTEAVLAKVLAKALWEHEVYDKSVFRAGIRVYGFGQMLIKQYNELCAHLPAMQARLDEAPNLAPILSPTLVAAHGPDTLRELRKIFLAHEGTPAGWRWLTRQGWTFIRRQVGLALTDQSNNRMFSAFAEAQVGRLPGSQRLNLNRHLFWDSSQVMGAAHQRKKLQERNRYLAMMRLFSREYERRKTKVSDLMHQLPLVQDFVSNMGPAENLNKATWSSLVRRQAEWHRKEARKRRERDKALRGAYGWAPLTEAQSHQSLVAVSLNTSDELWEEGDEMQHCVGGYAKTCFSNQSRIYSIRTLDGVRSATLELVQDRGRWQSRQLYGPHNQPIKDKAVEALARKVVRAANKAEPLNSRDNVILREPEHSSQFARPMRGPRLPAVEHEALEDVFEEIPF